VNYAHTKTLGTTDLWIGWLFIDSHPQGETQNKWPMRTV